MNAIDYLPTISYDVCNVMFINVFNVFCIKLKRKHGKQENMVLSVEAIKEIFRDLFKGHEQTLLTIVV